MSWNDLMSPFMKLCRSRNGTKGHFISFRRGMAQDVFCFIWLIICPIPKFCYAYSSPTSEHHHLLTFHIYKWTESLMHAKSEAKYGRSVVILNLITESPSSPNIFLQLTHSQITRSCQQMFHSIWLWIFSFSVVIIVAHVGLCGVYISSYVWLERNDAWFNPLDTVVWLLAQALLLTNYLFF